MKMAGDATSTDSEGGTSAEVEPKRCEACGGRGFDMTRDGATFTIVVCTVCGGTGGTPSDREEIPFATALQRLAETESRAAELHERLLYAKADLENARKRSEREREQVVRSANEVLLAELLPVLDEFELALDNLSKKSSKGVRMIVDNLARILREAGLEEIPAEGQPFDPYLHEAVERVTDDDLPDGTVKTILRKGYRYNRKVLRPAQVIVASKEGEPHG